MPNNSVETKNLDFTAHEKSYQRSIALYDGGRAVESGGFLIRHAWESEKQFEIRMSRAVYKNYAAPIVDVFAAAVCGSRSAASLPAYLTDLQGNVDRIGHDRETFFQEVARLSAGHGARFVLVDFEQSSKRPYFVQVEAQNFIDWAVGKDGQLSWAVIREIVEEERDPFAAPEQVTRYVVWTREEWARHDNDGNLFESGKHGLGLVPVVPFLFEPTGIMTGLSAIDEVASLLIRMFRRESELDKQLFDSAVALLVMAGVEKKDAEGFVLSSYNALTTPYEAKVYYVEVAGSSFESLERAIDRDVAAVREIALRQIRPVSGVGESAEAKRLDSKQLDCQLSKFARQCKNAEEQCWRIAAKWLKHDPAENEISTPYNESYDVDGIDSAVTDLLLRLRDKREISRNALLEHPSIKKHLSAGYDMQDDAVLLEREYTGQAGESGATGWEGLAKKMLARNGVESKA